MIVRGRVSATTDSSGAGAVTLAVPGTFGGLQSGVPGFSGRMMQEAVVWFANPTPGDAITSFAIVDSNGIIPSQAQALFPSYPLIKSWADSGLPTGNQGIYLPGEPLIIIPPPGQYIPSGLFMSMVIQKGTPGVDTFFANFAWDDGT